MKKIVIKEDFSFIYFLKSFYEISAIKESIKEYSDFFKAEVNEVGDYFVVKLFNADKDFGLKTLSYEFMNFVLGKEYNFLNKIEE